MRRLTALLVFNLIVATLFMAAVLLLLWQAVRLDIIVVAGVLGQLIFLAIYLYFIEKAGQGGED
jgi:hypothetical protein